MRTYDDKVTAEVHDYHDDLTGVLASSLAAQAIIRANLTDFPAAALDPAGLEAVHPDDFLLDQLDLSSPAILQVIRSKPPILDDCR